MLKEIKQVLRLTQKSKEQSVSMRRKLNIYWTCLALSFISILLFALSVSGVLTGSAKKMQSSLTLQQQNTANSLLVHMDSLEANVIRLSKDLTAKTEQVLLQEEKSFSQINNNQELIVKLEHNLYPILNTSLRSCKSSGAFFLLNATCNTFAPNAEDSRMGIYLRFSDLSGVNTVNKHIVYFRGVSDVARKEQIQMHNRWNLEFDSTHIPGYKAIMSSSPKRLADSCMYTSKVDLKDTWENVILLCVPILSSQNEVIGVCGVELSELYFRLTYPSVRGPFGDMVVGLCPIDKNTLYIGKAMLGRINNVRSNDLCLIVKEGKYFNEYVDIHNQQKFLGMHTIVPGVASDTDNLALVTLVKKDGYEKAIVIEKTVWTVSILGFLGIMFLFLKFLTQGLVTPIAECFDSIQKEIPYSKKSSGISEIDEFMEYLKKRDEDKIDKLPENIEDLFSTFKNRVNTLTPMERTVLQYYIDGLTLEEVANASYISINTAKKHNTNINRKLGVTGRNELMLYIDLFRRCSRLDEITYHNPKLQ